jgi:hypothetical protein
MNRIQYVGAVCPPTSPMGRTPPPRRTPRRRFSDWIGMQIPTSIQTPRIKQRGGKRRVKKSPGFSDLGYSWMLLKAACKGGRPQKRTDRKLFGAEEEYAPFLPFFLDY